MPAVVGVSCGDSHRSSPIRSAAASLRRSPPPSTASACRADGAKGSPRRARRPEPASRSGREAAVCRQHLLEGRVVEGACAVVLHDLASLLDLEHDGLGREVHRALRRGATRRRVRAPPRRPGTAMSPATSRRSVARLARVAASSSSSTLAGPVRLSGSEHPLGFVVPPSSSTTQPRPGRPGRTHRRPSPRVGGLVPRSASLTTRWRVSRQVRANPLLAPRQSGDTPVGEDGRAPPALLERRKEARRDRRLHHVELELPRAGSVLDDGRRSRNLEAHLQDELRDHGVHLAGHDRGARLHRGEGGFADAPDAARMTKTKIAASFETTTRSRDELRGDGDELIGVLERVEQMSAVGGEAQRGRRGLRPRGPRNQPAHRCRSRPRSPRGGPRSSWASARREPGRRACHPPARAASPAPTGTGTAS